jgi:hypothetical protein
MGQPYLITQSVSKVALELWKFVDKAFLWGFVKDETYLHLYPEMLMISR